MHRFFSNAVSRLGRDTTAFIAGAAVLAVGLLVYSGIMISQRPPVDPAAYAPLLNLIGQAESNDNYNAYFGSPANTTTDFTAMPIRDVLAWQAEYVRQGSPSSAVGRYQIINTTLEGLVRELKLDPNEKFDQSMQDRLAVALLERRGASAYLNDEISSEEFAANLAKEWAALPKVLGDNAEDSYYASDGLNRSRVKVGEVLAVIQRISG